MKPAIFKFRNNLGIFRSFASQSDITIVFDREMKRRHRDWSFSKQDSDYYDYLRKELAERVVDRYVVVKYNDSNVRFKSMFSVAWMI